MPESSRGPIPDRVVPGTDHAGQATDAGASPLRPPAFGASGSTEEPIQMEKDTARRAVIATRPNNLASDLNSAGDPGRERITEDGEPTASRDGVGDMIAGVGVEPGGAETTTEGAETAADGTKTTWRRMGPSRGRGGQGRCSGGSISVWIDTRIDTGIGVA
ncbi:hypothetical protein DFH06DRAFT_1216335 [Mycena polygramma]|nr:hypothetical protein DFH06DRAFT_1216335 [Mycena polygramma]